MYSYIFINSSVILFFRVNRNYKKNPKNNISYWRNVTESSATANMDDFQNLQVCFLHFVHLFSNKSTKVVCQSLNQDVLMPKNPKTCLKGTVIIVRCLKICSATFDLVFFIHPAMPTHQKNIVCWHVCRSVYTTTQNVTLIAS